MNSIEDILLKIVVRGCWGLAWFMICYLMFEISISIPVFLAFYIGLQYLMDSILGLPILHSNEYIESQKNAKENNRTELQKQWDQRDKEKENKDN